MERLQTENNAAGGLPDLTDVLEGGKREQVIFWPAQCNCGHIFFEKYQFAELTKEGNIGFCWCGFCRTKRMVKPSNAEITGAALLRSPR